jgi:hypothetical protein
VFPTQPSSITYFTGVRKGIPVAECGPNRSMAARRNPDSRLPAASAVSYRDSHRRWFALRYLSSRRYPAPVSEVGEHVASRLDSSREEVESKLMERDLPALSDCNVVKYDPYTDLVCLFDDRGTFEKYVRRAANAGAILGLTPPGATTG